MKSINRALLQLVDALTAERVPYMVIGGVAFTRWGSYRATYDVDVAIRVEEDDKDRIVERLNRTFQFRAKHTAEFFEQTRVLLLKNDAGVGLDVLFTLLPYEWNAIERAVDVIVEGRSVKFCTAEDLILYKVISPRPVDQSDIRQVLRQRGSELDFDYLEPKVKGLSELMERPEILEFWNAVKRESGLSD